MLFRWRDAVSSIEGEKVYAVVRAHGVTLWPRLCAAALVLVIPFFFLFTLMKAGWPGIFLFLALECAGVFMALRVFLQWQNKVLLITSHRVLHAQPQGLRGRRVDEISLHQIDDVLLGKRGLWEMVWGMGAIKVKTGEASTDVRVQHLPNPVALRELINQVRNGTQEQTEKEETTDQLNRVQIMLTAADAATLFAVESLLQTRKNAASKSGQDTDL